MGVRPSSIARSSKQNATPQEQLFDTHAESSLDFETVRQAARQKYLRPFLILDNAIVRDKARRFRTAMPRVRPHYAVKANPDRRVVKALMQEGCFEIASTAELDLLLSLGVDPAGVFYSNPVKSRQAIATAAGKGVEWYVVDSVDELRRVHEIKADAKTYLRAATPNIGCDWPVAFKFGAGAGEAREIVQTAAKSGADLAGVTFHAGSQCRNPENWRVGIEKARTTFDAMAKAGLKPRMLDIGGGFPVRHVKPIPSIEVIGDVVNEALKAFPPEVQVVAEPGRYLVSDAGYFVCRVIGTTTRAGKLDALGRGPVRRRDRDHRGPEVQDPHRPLGAGHPLARGGADLRLGGRDPARRAAALGPAGGDYITSATRRLPYGLRQRVQRFPLPEVRVFESKR
jgi:ornithine decarboxylase